jgi:hypothetical protein
VNRDGRRFHLYNLEDIDEINILDVANAISKQVRWMGHLKGDCWYSVAEHCVLVARLVKTMGGSVEDQFAALMHDASEAYLADIAAPFKRELGAYYEKEGLITARLMRRYRIAESMPKIVRDADWMLLWIEARDLLVDDIAICRPWVGFAEWGERALATDVKTFQWSPPKAREEFLALFDSLSLQRKL